MVSGDHLAQDLLKNAPMFASFPKSFGAKMMKSRWVASILGYLGCSGACYDVNHATM